MTEAFRRDRRMISFAIHLFIDAWPSGWMKTIMDCERNPKPAFFAYRDALEPILVSLRTDRFAYFDGEELAVEAFVANDTAKSGKYTLVYECDGKCAREEFWLSENDVTYVSNPKITLKAAERRTVKLKAILLDESGEVITYNEISFDVFPKNDCKRVNSPEIVYLENPGEYEICGKKVKVKRSAMLPMHFVSRKTGHKSVLGFAPKDFSYWYDKKSDMITPICENTFTVDGAIPILTSANTNENGKWERELACAELISDGKRYILTTVDLREENPVCKIFLDNLSE